MPAMVVPPKNVPDMGAAVPLTVPPSEVKSVNVEVLSDAIITGVANGSAAGQAVADDHPVRVAVFEVPLPWFMTNPPGLLPTPAYATPPSSDIPTTATDAPRRSVFRPTCSGLNLVPFIEP